MNLRERFMAKVTPSEGDECWPWLGYVGPTGYGFIAVGQRSPGGHCAPIPAHRVSYELFVGLIPDGLHIDHLCRNRRCVNPSHLEPVTPGENSRRGLFATRTSCAAGHDYTPENTQIDLRGHRHCRKCRRRYDADKRARKRAAFYAEGGEGE